MMFVEYALHARHIRGKDSSCPEGVPPLLHYPPRYGYSVVETLWQRYARLLSTTAWAARVTDHHMAD